MCVSLRSCITEPILRRITAQFPKYKSVLVRSALLLGQGRVAEMEDGLAIQSLPSWSFCDVSQPPLIETTVLGLNSNSCVWVSVEVYTETKEIVGWSPVSDILDWTECQLNHPSLWAALVKFMPCVLFVIPESTTQPRVLGRILQTLSYVLGRALGSLGPSGLEGIHSVIWTRASRTLPRPQTFLCDRNQRIYDTLGVDRPSVGPAGHLTVRAISDWSLRGRHAALAVGRSCF